MNTDKEFRLSDELNICNISVISGTRSCGRFASWDEPGRNSNGLLYIHSGEAVFFDKDGVKSVAGKGSFVFLPKFKVYKMNYSAASTYFILVNFDLFDKYGQNVSFSDNISVFSNDGRFADIAQIMIKLEQSSTSKSVSATFRRKELCYRIFGIISDLLHNNRKDGNDFSKIAAGVLLLEQTYLENNPTDMYAKESNISINRFRELFKRHFGMSPVKYRNKLRIERAKELLTGTNITVNEAAYASGFENIGYFCRYYLKETGETPTETKSKIK